ncbi:MAG: hypothetical protein ABIK54_01735 [candidate division WOR-3 bacterium]
MKRVVLTGLVLAAVCSAASLTWLGSLGTPYAECHGVSADGRVVAGWAGVYEPHYAWRWNAVSGMETLPPLMSGRSSEVWGLSADGSTVVGTGFVDNTSNYRGFWRRGDSLIIFGTLGGSVSWAYAASEDGFEVAGSAEHSSGYNHAFRWTADSGMQDLGVLPGALRSVGRAISLDGGVVVGWSGFANMIHHAFRWENGQMVDIHNPGFGQSEGIGVSGDGQVAVGAWGDASMTPCRPFRWTASTGMYDLGTLGGEWGEAWAANYDGSIVVGWSERSQGNWGAFRWTAQGGMEDLNVTYAQLLTPGSVLRDAMAISPDGRFIAGRGYNAATGRDEAYLLDTGPIGVAEQKPRIKGRIDGVRIFSGNQALIRFRLDRTCRVVIKIYDSGGRLVARPVDAVLEPGDYSPVFTLEPGGGDLLFCWLELGDAVYQQRLIRVR